MGQLLNFWTEDEATDLFYNIQPNVTYENFVLYLKDYAPHLVKKAQALWDEMDS